MPDETALPPWLTRQYDYATGIRQTGQNIAENLLRRRQLDIEALRQAAAAQQADAMERYRAAQAKALEDKQRREDEANQRYEAGAASVVQGLNDLGPNASPSEQRNVIFKEYRNLPPATFNAFLNSLGKTEAVKGAGERLDKTLDSREKIAEEQNATRLEVVRLQEELRNNPDNPQLQMRLKALELHSQSLDIARKNLELRAIQVGQADTRLNQAAVGRAAALAQQGFESNVPLLPGQSQAQSDQTISNEIQPPYFQEAAPPQNPPINQPLRDAQPPQELIRPVARPLTQANVTRNQEALSNSLTALKQIREVQPLINADTVGPIGAAKRVIVNRGLANLFPELLDKESVQVDEILTTLGSYVTRALKSDSNIAEAERKKLESTVPSQKEILQSPANAYAQLVNISNRLKDSSVRSLVNLKAPVPDELTPHLSSDDVKALVGSGSMTHAQAMRWYQLNRKK